MISSDIIVSTKDYGLFKISEGTGDNLLREDIECGYKDYIMLDPVMFISPYELEENYDDCKGYEGGQVMLDFLYQRKFKSAKDVVEYLKKNDWLPKEGVRIIYAS